MRRPSQLRVAALFGSLAAVVGGVLVSYLLFILMGRQGRLGFDDFDLAGLAQGLLFVIVLITLLRYVRWAFRIPGPTLLSFGLVAPPNAGRVAREVPRVESAQNVQALAENRVVVVEEAGMPVGITGVKRERITSWDDVIKVDAGVAVSDLRHLLAREPLVVVTDDRKVLGVVTQEMYLGGLWGRVR